MITNPFEMMFNPANFLTKISEMNENATKIHANNVKYATAFVAYNKAIQDMTEATNDNIELMKQK